MTTNEEPAAALEQVLTGTLRTFEQFGPIVQNRDFAATYMEATHALTLANIEYVLGWVMAYGLYARPRFTDNINILTLSVSRTKLNNLFEELGFQLTRDVGDQLSYEDPASGVMMRVEFGDSNPIRSAVANPARFQIFGVSTRVIEPEYLMWMYCQSNLSKHRTNAVELILAGHVDVARLRRLLQGDGKIALLKTVSKVQAMAEQERLSSYDASVHARIARMSRR